MRSTLILGVIFASATAFECSGSAFEVAIPSNTSVTLVQTVSQNGTFEAPAGDVAYPASPTGLRALCALQIKAPAPGNTSYEFGLFLPEDWNGRFLYASLKSIIAVQSTPNRLNMAVGNGGYAGGINWEDTVSDETLRNKYCIKARFPSSICQLTGGCRC